MKLFSIGPPMSNSSRISVHKEMLEELRKKETDCGDYVLLCLACMPVPKIVKNGLNSILDVSPVFEQDRYKENQEQIRSQYSP